MRFLVLTGLISSAYLAVCQPALAQAARPRVTDYLFAASVTDTRAIWVNPGGLGVIRDASIVVDFVLDWEATGDVRLSQWMAGFNSQGLSFAYQRDRFPDDPATAAADSRSTEAFRLATSVPFDRGALGGSVSLYRGGLAGNEWAGEVGIHYRLSRTVSAAGVLHNIGRPVLLNSPTPFGATLGMAWVAAPQFLVLATEARIMEVPGQSDVDATYRVGLRLSPSRRLLATLVTAVDIDDSFNLAQWVIGLSIGGDERGVILGSGSHVSGDLDFQRLSVGAVVSKQPTGLRP